jgi:hypothetical protein
MNMARIMVDRLVLEPLPQTTAEELVFEVFAPKGTEGNASFMKAAVQVQHTHQTGPLAGPISNRENRSAMMLEPGKNIVTVLPDGLGNNDWGVWMDLQENIHSHALAGDEPVSQIVAVWVRATQRKSLREQGRGEFLFHFGLRRPADLICGLAKVSTGDEEHFVGSNGSR